MVPINTLNEEKAIPYIPKFEIKRIVVTAKSRTLDTKWILEEPQTVILYDDDHINKMVDELVISFYGDEPDHIEIIREIA